MKYARDKRSAEFDPDAYRMTVGEHLDELRSRLILGLLGLGAAFVLCLVFGQRVIVIFCMPLIDALHRNDLHPQMVFTDVTDPFMVYLKISLISALAISAPWMLYQLWKFVAAGLYPRERKTITRYLPLSLTLLISGMLVVYFAVLPLALSFLIDFGTRIPLPSAYVAPQTVETHQPPFRVPVIAGDPAEPAQGDFWFNTIERRLKIQLPDHVMVLAFAPQSLLTPLVTLPDYINLVIVLLLAFGLSFQLPLVVLALVRVGIVRIEMLREGRKYAYFGLAVLSAVVTPGDVPSMIGLMIPLMLLYELGLWLAARSAPASQT